MNTKTAPNRSPLNDLLAEPLRVGEPDVAGPLTVFPLFGPEPRADYVGFAQGRERGVKAGELEGGASVNDLLVQNPTDSPVLLFEGEEVLGAQQNRTFDVSVLVAAGAKVRVPVSCVEAGRWDGSRHGEDFEAAPQAAYPALRRAKALQARARVSAGLEARADQSAVWSEVAAKSSRMGTHSPTGAMHDIYEDRRSRLHEMQEAIELREGQIGAVAASGGQLLCLDYVSRPEAYASLHGPLVQGYALDALETTEAEAPEQESASGFALLVTDCEPAHREPGIGLGETLRFAANGVAGTALVNDGELIQLTAFPGDELESDRPAALRRELAGEERLRGRGAGRGRMGYRHPWQLVGGIDVK